MSISESLFEKAEDKMDMDVFKAIDIGTSTGISYPMLEFIVSNPFMQDHFLAEVANANDPIWRNLEQFPAWKEFILEAISAREAKGTKSPVSPLSVAILIIESNPQLEEQIKQLLGLDYFNQYEVITNPEYITKLFDYLLNDPAYRITLRQGIIDFVYYSSSSYVDNYEVIQFIREDGVESPVVLDIGCGFGRLTHDLYRDDGRTVIGIDRQYYQSAFDENWNESKGGVEFMQGDAQSLPFADESIDYAVATSLIGHLSREAVAKVVSEATRVIKAGGYLIVGPQQVAGFGMYRYFRKNAEGLLQETT